MKQCIARTRNLDRCRNSVEHGSIFFCRKHRWWWLLTAIPLMAAIAGFLADVFTIKSGIPTITPTPTQIPTIAPSLTITPSSTPTITPSATVPPPASASDYYMIVLDASETMQESFDGRSKWRAALESISIILEGLNPNSHYGLVLVGGSDAGGNADSCGNPSEPVLSFGSKENIQTEISNIQPVGGGSFFNGFVLARRQLEDLPANTVKTLIYNTGSSDACESRNEWSDLERILSLPNAVGLYSEIIILDEDGLRSQTIAEQINSLSENVNVQAPQNNQELRDTTNTNVVDNVTDYVNTETESIASQTPGPVSADPDTPTPTPTFTPTNTPTIGPIITLTNTPSKTSTPTPTPTLCIAWEFENPGDTEGWQVYRDIINLRAEDGRLRGEIIGIRQSLLSPEQLNIDTSKYTVLALGYLIISDRNSGQVMWNPENNENFTGARHIRYGIAADGELHDLDVHLDGNADWTSTIIVNKFRLDPADDATTGSFEYDYIRICQ